MGRCILASTGLVFGLLTWTVPATGDEVLPRESVQRMRPVIPAAINYYNERTDDPLPVLTTDQTEDLLEGKVVRIRRRPARDIEDPPERVTGYRIVPLPREKVWVAALDPDFQATELLTEHLVSQEETGVSMWHQYLSLPWPVTDRHWVIRVGMHTDLARESGDLVWELVWNLAPGGEDIARASIAAGNMGQITPEIAADAIYVPTNEGSWVMFQLEEDITLVGYRIIARVGGSIPDSWIATVGMAQLAQVLNAVARHADTITGSYDPSVHSIRGGNGEPIGQF